MATITAALVKELREETGVGMMECKRALVQADGDKAAAIKFLRESGAAVAAKKASRAAKDGMISATVSADLQSGRMIEVNCETDFVTKNADFQAFVKELLADAEGIEDNSLATVQAEKITKAIQKIGENLVARRNISYKVQGTGAIASYVHLGGKLGVMVELGCTKAESVSSDVLKALMENLTLHITAVAPVCVSRSEVPAEMVEAEKAIYVKQVEGKPANIIEKIVNGKLDKYFSQICLLEQESVKDKIADGVSKSIQQVLDDAGKKLDDTLTIRRFVRWQLGA